jgi:transposase-like protein
MKKKTYFPNLVMSDEEYRKRFPDSESAMRHLERMRWKDGIACPACKGMDIRRLPGKHGFHQCNSKECRKQFNVRTGTIFEHSNIPLHRWFYAIYLELTSRKGISSINLSSKIGVSQKTAWFMQHRIREAMGRHKENLMLIGVTDADETYIGGKEKNKHLKKRLFPGAGAGGKFGAIGIVRRHGKAITTALPNIPGRNSRNRLLTVPDTSKETLQGIIKKQVRRGSIINTDGHMSYSGLSELGYKHWQVSHAARRYAIGIANTNTIESRWAVLKRTYHGTHHWFSRKHMQRYFDAFDFRHNEANRGIPTMDALGSLLKGCFGTRLPYKNLVGENI